MNMDMMCVMCNNMDMPGEMKMDIGHLQTPTRL